MIRYLWVELAIRIKGALGWGLGLGLFSLFMPTLFPQLSSQFAELDLSNISIYQALGVSGDFGTLKGFLSAYMLSTFVPMICVYAIIAGTATLAGEEDEGTLEMVLSLPLKRWQIVASKLIAIGMGILLIGLSVSAGFVLGTRIADVSDQVETRLLWDAGLNLWPIGMVIASFSLFLGAYLPNRRIAWITATIVMLYTFLWNSLGSQVEALDKYRPISPFYYYTNGLTELVWAKNNLILFTMIAVFSLLAILAFQKRNVTVGAWPWQRAPKESGKLSSTQEKA